METEMELIKNEIETKYSQVKGSIVFIEIASYR